MELALPVEAPRGVHFFPARGSRTFLAHRIGLEGGETRRLHVISLPEAINFLKFIFSFYFLVYLEPHPVRFRDYSCICA